MAAGAAAEADSADSAAEASAAADQAEAGRYNGQLAILSDIMSGLTEVLAYGTAGDCGEGRVK